MSSALHDQPAGPGDIAAGPASGSSFELVTTLRGRKVSCWIEDGTVRGDPELLHRLERFSPLSPADDLDLWRLVRTAVGSDVRLRERTAVLTPH
jgi:hypothetical protein